MTLFATALSFVTRMWTLRPVSVVLVGLLALSAVVAVPIVIVASVNGTQDELAATAPSAPPTKLPKPTPVPVETPATQTVGNLAESSWTYATNVVIDAAGVATQDQLRIVTSDRPAVSIDPNDALSGLDIIREIGTITGPDDDLAYVIAAAYRVPAHGLTPESSSVLIAMWSLSSGRLLNTVVVDTSASADLSVNSLSGSEGSVVALGYFTRTGDGVFQSVGIDALTGAVIWAFDNGAIVAAGPRGVAVETYGEGFDGDVSKRSCAFETGIETRSGKTLWQVDSHAQPFTSGSCARLDVYAHTLSGTDQQGSTYGVLAVVYATDVAHGEQTGINAFDLATGETRYVRAGAMSAYDPVTGYAVEDDGTGAVVVYDTHSGSTLYQLDGATASKLQARVFSLYGGYLYLSTSDGTPVVDIESGEVVADASATYPTQQIGSWTQYADGTISADPHRNL